MPQCPCTIWDPVLTVPAVSDSGDVQPHELGVKFMTQVDGFVSGVRFYRSPSNAGPHTGSLWTAAGQLLATGTFENETAWGWQELTFASPVAVAANTTYVASYFAPSGHYAADSGYFASPPEVTSPVRALGSAESPNGVFRAGSSGFPEQSYQDTNYWVDVVFAEAHVDVLPPQVRERTPQPGQTHADTRTAVSVRFNEPLDALSVGAGSLEVRTLAGQPVAGSLGYDAATYSLTFRPASALETSAEYSVRLTGGASGVRDVAGNMLPADDEWTFTTAAWHSVTIWGASAVPDVVDSGDPNSYELGVRFRADVEGYITGVRFYKAAGNIGRHLVNLWTETGQLLATAVATGETAAGWQEASFPTPVAVEAGTAYVASYHAPFGHYSYSGEYFAASGMSSPPLHALSGAEGPNGVYKTGASGFPTETYGFANYWVDVSFVPNPPPDLKSASDTLSVTLSDADALLASLLQTDTMGLTVSEVAALVATLTATDAGTLASTETPTLSVEASAAESLSVGSSEVAGLTTAAEASDTLSVGMAEAVSALSALVAAADTLGLTASEAAGLSVEADTGDALSVTVSDAPVLVVLIDTSEAAFLALVEQATLDAGLMPIAASDTLSVSLSSLPVVAVVAVAQDALHAALAEGAALEALVAGADVAQVAVSEQGAVSATAAASDQLAVSAALEAALAWHLSASDVLSLALGETIQVDATDVPVFVVARAPRLRWLLPTHTLRSRLPAYGLRCGLSGDWTMTAKITEGRTEPIPLLVEVDGAPIDLTGLTLSLIARRRDGTYLDTTGQLAAHPDQSAEGGHRGEVYWSPADTTTIRVADGPLTLRVRVEHGDPIKRRHHAESDPLILSVLRA